MTIRSLHSRASSGDAEVELDLSLRVLAQGPLERAQKRALVIPCHDTRFANATAI
jgi:hypothetical protein